MKIENAGTGYTITRDDGTVIELTWNEASLLHNMMDKDTLRSNIAEAVDALTEDMKIDPEKFDDGTDGFIEEIFTCFEDDVEQTGQQPDEDEIKERILDEAKWYDGVLIEED